MALRTSGHLLLGVVRIYSRKAKYLLADCNEAFVKIKMAFRPGMVDLPEENREAAVNAITLPEVFHDFDTEMPDLNDVDISAQFSMNQTRAEEITMREDYGNINLEQGDDDFGGPGVAMDETDRSDRPEELRSGSVAGNTLQEGSSLFPDQQPSTSALNDKGAGSLMGDDGFGGSGGGGEDGFGGGDAGGELFESGGLFDEPAPAIDASSSVRKTPTRPGSDMSDDDRHMDDFGGGGMSPGRDSDVGGASPARPPSAAPASEDAPTPAPAAAAAAPAQEQTTLLHNEEESFALAPVDASALRPGMVRTKRKRKIIVDEVKAIAGEEMKAQVRKNINNPHFFRREIQI